MRRKLKLLKIIFKRLFRRILCNFNGVCAKIRAEKVTGREAWVVPEFVGRLTYGAIYQARVYE